MNKTFKNNYKKMILQKLSLKYMNPINLFLVECQEKLTLKEK